MCRLGGSMILISAKPVSGYFRLADNPGGTFSLTLRRLTMLVASWELFLHLAGSFLHSALDSISQASMSNR